MAKQIMDPGCRTSVPSVGGIGERKEAAPRLKVMRGGVPGYPWFEVTGSREDLVLFGIAQVNWFAEGRQRVRQGEWKDGRGFWSSKRVRGGLFTVRLHQPSGELTQMLTGMATEETECVRAEEARRAGKLLAEMRMTRDEYRAQQVRMMTALMASMTTTLATPNDYDGFSYEEEVRAELSELAGEMLDLMKTGTIIFDAKRHTSIVQAHKAKIARGDSGFVRVLSALAVAHGTGEEVDHA